MPTFYIKPKTKTKVRHIIDLPKWYCFFFCYSEFRC